MKSRALLLSLSLALGACAGPGLAASPTPPLLPLPSATPSPVVAAPPATPVIIASPTFTPTPVTYVVQPGDTLIAIAVKFGVSVEALQAANNNVQPEFLSIGAVLVIPDPQNTDAAQAVVPPALPPPVPIPLSAPACYPAGTGALYCFVEARNPTDTPLESVSARITLAGADGLPLVTGVAHSALDVIPPGAGAPLGVLFPSAPPGIAATGAELLAGVLSPESSARRVALEITTHTGAGSGARWTITGQVRNPSPAPAAAAWVVATLYDRAGAIVGYRKIEVAGGLPAGAAADFTLTVASLGGAIDHYAVLAEGRP
jgi:LysM repeat protein